MVAQIIQERIYSPSNSNIPLPSGVFIIYTFPVLMVFASALLLFSFSLMILAIFGGLSIGNMALRPSPFAAYEGIWPGQSSASVAAYGMRIPQGYMPCISGASPLKSYSGLEVRVAPGAYNALGTIVNCMSSPKDGVFHWMTMTIIDNRVKELNLFSDVLKQDTLLLYWGAPDAISKSDNDSQLNLYWERRTYSVIASILELDSVVKRVKLTAKK